MSFHWQCLANQKDPSSQTPITQQNTKTLICPMAREVLRSVKNVARKDLTVICGVDRLPRNLTWGLPFFAHLGFLRRPLTSPVLPSYVKGWANLIWWTCIPRHLLLSYDPHVLAFIDVKAEVSSPWQFSIFSFGRVSYFYELFCSAQGWMTFCLSSQGWEGSCY
jgi:hypothetical protein